jgi:dTDP-4-dehydrorhamnose reductase
MRIAVTGRNGQLARALAACNAPGFDVVAVGRPRLDLMQLQTTLPALSELRPDVIVNAAAFTAVDAAEQQAQDAFAVNAAGAAAVAAAATHLGVPLLHLSTDFVFDGAKASAYVETDAPKPLNVYGASKLAGEEAVRKASGNHAIVRLGWLYSPVGKNFVRTMLRLAETQDRIAVTSDRRGGPTCAQDVAEALLEMARALTGNRNDTSLRGVFHLAPPDDASWAQFAETVFDESKRRGGPRATVDPIASRDYPEAARRPAHSRLNSDKLAAAYGVRLPPWRQSLSICLDAIFNQRESEPA